MSSNQWPEKVAVLYEAKQGPGDLARAFAEGFLENGCDVDLLDRQEDWNQHYDFVLGYGPSTWEGSLLPTAQRLLSFSANDRPFFFWWFIECIPNPAVFVPLIKLAARLRISVDRRTVRRASMRRRLQSARLYSLFLRGFRLQILGELYHFKSNDVLDGLAITSRSRARYLRRHGFDPIVVPIGYSRKLHGRDLELDRDIDVGFLGNIHSGRRFPLLQKTEKALKQRGIDLSIQTHLYGKKRTEFFNRTKTNLNIFRAPYDFFGLRFVFCAANKTLLISEPVVDYEPFVPGRDLVVCPLEKIPDAVEFYISHEDQRRGIVDRAYDLIRAQFTMKQMTGRILEHAREVKFSA